MNIFSILFILVQRMPRSKTSKQKSLLTSLRSSSTSRKRVSDKESMPKKLKTAPSQDGLLKIANGDASLQNNGSDDDSSDLLWHFVTHTDSSFHDISPSLAGEMKSRLLHWYRDRKRKLPWRGDALHLFNNNESSYSTCDKNSIIPISGYSVWVSEVMLQQTRVETVIPYYIQCTFLSFKDSLVI